jgi:hypothetical protein
VKKNVTIPWRPTWVHTGTAYLIKSHGNSLPKRAKAKNAKERERKGRASRKKRDFTGKEQGKRWTSIEIP